MCRRWAAKRWWNSAHGKQKTPVLPLAMFPERGEEEVRDDTYTWKYIIIHDMYVYILSVAIKYVSKRADTLFILRYMTCTY